MDYGEFEYSEDIDTRAADGTGYAATSGSGGGTRVANGIGGIMTLTDGRFNFVPGRELEFYREHFDVDIIKSTFASDLELDARPLSGQDRVCDVLLLMDCTGSMGSWIELCKRKLCECVDSIVANRQELDVRVAFVGYRDFCDPAIFKIHDFSLDVQAVKGFISSQRAEGGGDAPEDVQGGLFQGLHLNWRPNSIKMCYLCADAPAHGQQYQGSVDQGDTFPKGSPLGLELETLVQEYSNREVELSVYSLGDQTNAMYDVMEQAYNQGATATRFKRISLQRQIETAQDMGESLTKFGGMTEQAYFEETANDMEDNVMNGYAMHGWL